MHAPVEKLSGIQVRKCSFCPLLFLMLWNYLAGLSMENQIGCKMNVKSIDCMQKKLASCNMYSMACNIVFDVCVCVCVFSAADGEEFVNVLTELLFDLHVAATPDKLNKVTAVSLSLSLSLTVPVSVWLCVCVSLPHCLFRCLSLFLVLTVSLSIHLSINPCVSFCLSVCLQVCRNLSTPAHSCTHSHVSLTCSFCSPP